MSISKTISTQSNFPVSQENQILAYNGAGCTNVPGMTNLLYAPGDISNTTKALFKAYDLNDQEALLDTLVRISGMPFSILHAFLTMISNALEACAFFKLISSPVLKFTFPIVIFGLALTSIEGIYELVGLKRSIKFSIDIHHQLLGKIAKILNAKTPKEQVVRLEKFLQKLQLKNGDNQFPNALLKILDEWKSDPGKTQQQLVNILEQFKEPLTKRALTSLHSKFFTLSENDHQKIRTLMTQYFSGLKDAERDKKLAEITEKTLTVKKNKLARRVRPWLAAELDKELPILLSLLNSANPHVRKRAVQRGEALFHKVKTQTDKKLFMSILGGITILLTLAGLALMLIGAPYLLPLLLITAGGALSILSSVLHAGLMDNEGWKVTWSNAVPEFVKTLYHKLFTKKVASVNKWEMKRRFKISDCLNIPPLYPKKTFVISDFFKPLSNERAESLSSCFAYPKALTKKNKFLLLALDHRHKHASPSRFLRV